MRAELQGVANQYAQAVFELAVQTPGTDDAVLSDLQSINQIVKQNPDLKVILAHPAIAAERKKKFLMTLFTGKASDLTLRLLGLLCDRRRIELLPQIEHECRRLLNERKNIVAATITCSEPLKDASIANIKARLTEHLGKRLELEVKVDRSLIGGVVLRLGDQVIDGSIKGRLNELEKSLLSV